MDLIIIPSVVTAEGITLRFKFSQAAKRRMKESGVDLTKDPESRTPDENEFFMAAAVSAMAYVEHGGSLKHAGLSVEDAEELLNPLTFPIYSKAVTDAFLAVVPTMSLPLVGQAGT